MASLPDLDHTLDEDTGPCCDHGYRELPDGSVAPCKTHRPDVHARWIGRHMTGECPEGCQGCRDARKGRRQRAST